jgi:hypothetical protein
MESTLSFSTPSPRSGKPSLARRRHSVRIGDGIPIEIEDFVPRGLQAATRLQNILHPSNTTLTVAKPVSSRISAFGMTFANEGRSAFSAPFSWQA